MISKAEIPRLSYGVLTSIYSLRGSSVSNRCVRLFSKLSGKVVAGQYVRVLLRSHVVVSLGSGLKLNDVIKPLNVLAVSD